MKITLINRSKFGKFTVRILLILPIFFITPRAYSTEKGEAFSASFLQVSPSPRQTALGGGQAAVTGHFDSLFSNPASLTTMSIPEFYLSHNESFLGTSYETIGFGLPLQKNGLGVTLQYVGDSKINRTGVDSNNAPVSNLGQFQPYIGAGQITWAHRFMSRTSFGFTAKAWSEHLDQKSYTGLAGDAGLITTNFFPNFDVGVALRNIGSKINEHPLPQSLDLGGAYHFHPGLLKPITLLTNYSNVKKSRSLRFGVESQPNKILSIRAGYQLPLSDDLKNFSEFSFGGGLRFRGWQLDYSWKGTEDLGDTHLLSLTLGLGLAPDEKRALAETLSLEMNKRMSARVEEHLDTAEQAISTNNWDIAFDELSKALTWDPSDVRAKDRLAFAVSMRNFESSQKLTSGGKTSLEQSKWIDATLQFQQALKLNPQDMEAQKGLSIAKEKISMTHSKMDSEKIGIQKIFNKGITFYIEGHFQAALNEWEKVLEIAPTWPDVQEYSAKARANILEQKLSTQSKQSYSQKQYLENLTRNAYTYYTLGNMDEAVAAWKKVLALDPTNEEAKWALKAASEKTNYAEPQESNEKDRRVQELNARAFNEYSSGKLDKSIFLWKKALQIDPRNSRIKNNIQRVENELVLKENVK